MNALSVIFYGSLFVAVATSIVAVASPRLRTRLLIAAAALYAVAGVLGILSVGVLLLAAAAICATLAMRGRPPPPSRHA